MKTAPIPLRLEKDIEETLAEGVRRTPFPKQELIRLTLRRYLHRVIEREAVATKPARLTSVAPWPKGKLAQAYRHTARDWDALEGAATEAQGPPNWSD